MNHTQRTEFPTESPSDPIFYYLYGLNVPLFLLGTFSNLSVLYGFYKAQSLALMSTAHRLLLVLVFFSFLWSVYNATAAIVNLYYNSEALVRFNLTMNPLWLEFVLWFNVSLAMERFFRVKGLHVVNGSRIYFLVAGLVFLVTLILSLFIGIALPVPQIDYYNWKLVLPITLMITTPTSLLLYQQTFRLAAKQLRVFIASHGQEYVTKSNRTMVKNSLLMTTSILLLYSPQIIAFYFLPMDPQIGENEINIRMSVIVFVNVLAGLDPIVTAVLVLYFARDVRIYLHKMVFFWRNTED